VGEQPGDEHLGKAELRPDLSLGHAAVETQDQDLPLARRGLRQSRRETTAASQERDDRIEQRDTGRADVASKLSDLRNLRRRLAPAQTAAQPDPPVRRPTRGEEAISPAADVPADATEPDVTGSSPAIDVVCQCFSPRRVSADQQPVLRLASHLATGRCPDVPASSAYG
jgi:hypothetical protein